MFGDGVVYYQLKNGNGFVKEYNAYNDLNLKENINMEKEMEKEKNIN